MEGLIDFIFSNPFLLILIIGGLMSLFKRKTEQPEQEQKNVPNRPLPMPAETRMETVKEKTRPPKLEPQPVNKKMEVRPVEQYRQQQMEELKNRLNVNNERVNHYKGSDQNVKSHVHSLTSKNDKRPFKRHFKDNVTRSGLINSVIMSEVLGPPRAMKPYEGMPYKRKYHR